MNKPIFFRNPLLDPGFYYRFAPHGQVPRLVVTTYHQVGYSHQAKATKGVRGGSITSLAMQ